ncbi:MAG: hypothetical protein WKF77_28035 [Planctomycetaceae bacterium]
MPINVVCPQCGKTLRVGDHVAGKKIRCPACHGVIAVLDSQEPDHDGIDTQDDRKIRSVRENREPSRRRMSEQSAVHEFPDDCFDSYGQDAAMPPAARARGRKSGENSVKESGGNPLLRKHRIESMAASGIGAVWCRLFGLAALFLMEEADGIDMDKIKNFGVAMLIFSGTLLFATCIQIPKIIPLLYVSMILVGVTGAMLSMATFAGEWLMIVSSVASFISLHRLRSVVKLLQNP